MKQNIVFPLLLLTITLFTSCRKDRFIQTGEGPSVFETRTIDHFQKLDLSLAADVEDRYQTAMDLNHRDHAREEVCRPVPRTSTNPRNWPRTRQRTASYEQPLAASRYRTWRDQTPTSRRSAPLGP